MELIARIALRLHQINDVKDDSPEKSEKSVAIFRIVGQSPDKAVKTLDREVALSYRPLVALAFPSITVTEAQEKVYDAVVAACRLRSSRVFTCGGASEKLSGQARLGGGSAQWFPSVSKMVQDFGEITSRYDTR